MKVLPTFWLKPITWGQVWNLPLWALCWCWKHFGFWSIWGFGWLCSPCVLIAQVLNIKGKNPCSAQKVSCASSGMFTTFWKIFVRLICLTQCNLSVLYFHERRLTGTLKIVLLKHFGFHISLIFHITRKNYRGLQSAAEGIYQYLPCYKPKRILKKMLQN